MSVRFFRVCFLMSCSFVITLAFASSPDSENATSVTTSESETPIQGESSSASSSPSSVTTNATPEIVGPPSRTYFRNAFRVNSVRRNGRTFTNGENTIESPLRPTASAQEYPRGTGVGSYAEVGMAVTRSPTDRTGRSFLGATEASVSDSSISLMTSVPSMVLILLSLLTTARFWL